MMGEKEESFGYVAGSPSLSFSKVLIRWHYIPPRPWVGLL